MPSHTNLLSHDLSPRELEIALLKPLGRETRRHPHAQIEKLANSLTTFGFVLPIVVDDQMRVIAGWALARAARRLLLTHVPAVTVSGLTDAQLRALRLALNRLTEDSAWNPIELRLELEEILKLDVSFDLTTTAFEMGEIDLMLGADPSDDEPAAEPPDRSHPAITQPGDLWLLGNHRLLCADALCPESYRDLLDGTRVRTVFTDPPYNVPIQGHVSGKGRVLHFEFTMASGEMSSAEFTTFLESAITLMTQHSLDGALHYLCMDWRHLYELHVAGRDHYSELKNLCVWNKTNAGMGSFYRSKHELIAIYKVGSAKHINNIALGRHGRNRTNVWDYAGANTFRAGRMDDLEAHPTVKPTALVADAILDSSNRGDAVLDPFLGSGTTLFACERTGRVGFGMELDPYYVDSAIARWQTLSGIQAIHAETKEPFNSAASRRQFSNPESMEEFCNDE